MPSRTRRLAPLAAALAAALVGGCQDYTFSPVNYSIIQPGTVRVTLSDISTADLLFVVDDSGSMGGEQQKLAQSFDAFVNALRATNTARVNSQLEPIDFHIAVTTTSVFLNQATTSTCQSDCTGAAGQPTCCDEGNRPLQVDRACTTPGSASGCGAGNTCRTDCLGRAGEPMCCNGPGTFPEKVAQRCTVLGDACGQLQTRYGTTRVPASCVGVGVTCPSGTSCRTDCPDMSGAPACCDAGGQAPTCDPGVGSVGGLYPRGDFVAKGANDRVLHFDKALFCTREPNPTTPDPGDTRCADNLQDTAAIGALIAQFKQNVAVGTCGSGQEQPLEAARRAIQKAQAGQQPGVAAGEWLHTKEVGGRTVPASKLVVVFVGDEDDCSSPEDAAGGLVFTETSCESDTTRRFATAEYTSFLASLGRPVAGAFIVSATSNTCQDGDCNAGICCDTTCTGNASVCTVGGLCGGQGAGTRLLTVSRDLAALGLDRVAGSICNPGTAQKPGFSSILERVAEVVKQPVGLRLPTVPAVARLTVLRILDAGGGTRKTCVGPAPEGASAADQANYEWWFTAGDDTNPAPTGTSQFIYINRNRPDRGCEANPGETYSADYLGKVPAGGCTSTADCAVALGNNIESWRCCVDIQADGSCVPPPGGASATTGTCLVAGP